MRIKLRLETKTSKGLLAAGSIVGLENGEANRLVANGSANPLPEALGPIKEVIIKPTAKPQSGKPKTTHSTKRG